MCCNFKNSRTLQPDVPFVCFYTLLTHFVSYGSDTVKTSMKQELVTVATLIGWL